MSNLHAFREQLENAEKQYIEFINFLPFIVVEIDFEGKVKFANEYAFDFFGYTEEDVKYGVNVFQLLIPEHHAMALENIAKAAKGETKIPYEYTARKRDGTMCHLVLHHYPVLRENKLQGLLLAAMDITKRKEHEETLRMNEEKYRSIFENAVEGIFQTTPDGRYLSVNPALAKMYGYESPEEMMMFVANIEERICADPQDCTKFKESLNENGFILGFETQLKKKDASQIWVSLNAWTVRNMDDSARYYEGTVEDITQRKNSEDKLIESERKFRAIFDQTFQFIGLMALDGTLLNANKAALNLIGVAESDVLFKPFWDTPWWTHSPGLREELRSAVKEAANGKLVQFEATHMAVDGTFHYIDFSLKPASDENGDIVFLIPEGRDITKRKEAEKKLRESEAGFRALLEAMQDLVFLIDKEGRYISIASINSDLLCKPAEDLIGKTFHDIYPIKTADFFLKSIRRSIKTKKTINIEYQEKIDGTDHWFMTAISPMTQSSVIWVGRDITEYKNLEEELRTKTTSLEEANAALKALVRHIEETKREIEENILINVNTLVQPYIEKMQRLGLNLMQKTFIDIIQTNLHNIISPFLKNIGRFGLTPSEMSIARLIRDGRATKEIAELLHVSPRAVEVHRYNIRKKLNINKNKINLRSFLLSKDY
ncbi:MAG: PAS domain S-box protein [Proteobacteria bacterium]|nr:PAS domain S-box protein [Pseudomonadota bacterium]